MIGKKAMLFRAMKDDVNAGGGITRMGGDPAASGTMISVGGRPADAATPVRPGDLVMQHPRAQNG